MSFRESFRCQGCMKNRLYAKHYLLIGTAPFPYRNSVNTGRGSSVGSDAAWDASRTEINLHVLHILSLHKHAHAIYSNISQL